MKAFEEIRSDRTVRCVYMFYDLETARNVRVVFTREHSRDGELPRLAVTAERSDGSDGVGAIRWVYAEDAARLIGLVALWKGWQ